MTLDLPDHPIAAAALALVRRTEHDVVANHSVRSFLFAELLARHEGIDTETDYDRDLLFAATVMHDLGTGSLAPGAQRFEVEGADLAAALLAEHGADAGRIGLVWEAIALHTSGGIAERRGWLTYLTREGVGADFGRRSEILLPSGAAIHERYPRMNMASVLAEAIIEHAGRSVAAAPRYSMAAELLRQRQADGITAMEVEAAGSPWGR